MRSPNGSSFITSLLFLFSLTKNEYRQVHSFVLPFSGRSARFPLSAGSTSFAPLALVDGRPTLRKHIVLGASKVEPGVGIEGCMVPSPSGINAMSTGKQVGAFLGYYVVLAIGTLIVTSLLDKLTVNYEWFQSYRYTWPLLGAVYVAAGIAHFTVKEEFINIFPSPGSWGFWKLPGSAKFHVEWTGVAEILGGLGLCIGGAYDAFAPVYTECPNLLTAAGIGSDSAAGLFLLTLAVTPANIFMWTHGAKLPREGPDVPVSFHYVRAGMQVLLLSLLYEMGAGTFLEIL